ncbi:low molecular weight phosphatase family protein [Naasia sp. SYSU D00948]|uniref:arsenate reductase/protein-tyrosine-phosphatase family protein n=1 Tax=Naasia sp. SYSU D00948 TaxID=2817379 RepID=UPI001B30AF03|nr:low molecular weight phosphatase family protein [Naasia sp. SYSU D00948]
MNRDEPDPRQRSEFSILTVCSGNLCRSPLAEQLLRARLADVPGVVVASAGTVARDGDAMTPQAQALSRRFGGDPSAHAARYLVEPHVAQAGLVLAMAREHRAQAVTLHPRASRRTFSLREFARLTHGLTADDLARIDALPGPAARLAALVDAVAAKRGFVEMPEDPADDDIVDPYRRSDATYERSAQQLVPAVERAAAVLRRAAVGAA